MKKFIDGIEDGNNVLLCFYDPKKEVASPMIEVLRKVMDDEQAFILSVGKIDRTKANADILKQYNINEYDTIVAIDKKQNGYPAVKTCESFIEMRVRKIVKAHKMYKSKNK